MSVKRAFFRSPNLGEIYNCFPDRLLDFLLEKHVVLGNEFHSLLSTEEEEGLSFFINGIMFNIQKEIDYVQSRIQDIKDDPYNSIESRRERFKDILKIMNWHLKSLQKTFIHKL